METTELMHYGVKGMKWGVRRKRSIDLGPPGGVKGGPKRQEGTPAGAKGGPKREHGTPDGARSMKWSARKTRKWATSKYQPSSARSSVLAGVYAATGNERVGKALDKSNARDAADWQRAKKEYKEYSARQADKKTAKNAKKTMAKGAEATAKALSKVGQAYITDQIFWGGMGTKVAKETVNAMGRATITAYTMARGGYDIKWYDEQGRRVG